MSTETSTSSNIAPPAHEFYKAKILNKEIVDNIEMEESIQRDPNHNINYRIKILEGVDSGKVLSIWGNTLDYKNGDIVYIDRYNDGIQEPYYFLNEKVRTTEIVSSVLIFSIFVIVLFGRKGFKALASLTCSIGIIFFILLPLTLKGYNPVLVSSATSILLLTSMILITNGRNQLSYSAIIGCSISIFITIVLSYFVISLTSISGKTDELAYYVNYLNGTYINFSLIVISSMIIGVIGAVDDGSITQASVVKQLKVANPNLSKYELYKRAMEVGRDHAGAMINTLILAYVASSIPLLLANYLSPLPWYILLNQENISVEIFRATIGSIGLLMAIPITTLVSIYFINKDSKETGHIDNSFLHNH